MKMFVEKYPTFKPCFVTIQAKMEYFYYYVLMQKYFSKLGLFHFFYLSLIIFWTRQPCIKCHTYIVTIVSHIHCYNSVTQTLLQ